MNRTITNGDFTSVEMLTIQESPGGQLSGILTSVALSNGGAKINRTQLAFTGTADGGRFTVTFRGGLFNWGSATMSGETTWRGVRLDFPSGGMIVPVELGRSSTAEFYRLEEDLRRHGAEMAAKAAKGKRRR